MIFIYKNHFQSFHSLPILNTFGIKWVSFTRRSSSSSTSSFLFSWKKVSEKTWLMLKMGNKKVFYDVKKDTLSMQWVSIRSGQLDKPSSEIIINFYVNSAECFKTDVCYIQCICLKSKYSEHTHKMGLALCDVLFTIWYIAIFE